MLLVRNLKLFYQGLLLVSVLLLLELVLLGTFNYLLNQSEAEKAAAERSRDIVFEGSELTKMIYDTGAALLAYGLTRNSLFAQRYENLIKTLPDEVRSLDQLADLTASDRESMRDIADSTNRAEVLMNKCKNIVDAGWGFGHTTELKQILQKQLNPIVNDLVGHLARLTERHRANESFKRQQIPQSEMLLKRVIWFGIVFNVVIAWILIFAYSKRITDRLQVLNENTKLLAQGKSISAPIGGTDEIANLDRVFHDMVNTLAESKAREQELERARREFINIVSHDLRTPLTSVQVILKLIPKEIDGALTKPGTTILQTAQEETARLINLINDLLDIAKIESGKLELTLHDTDIAQVLQNSVESIRALADKKQIAIDVQPTKLSVHADSDRLIQVLVNLLSNAIKFSEPQTKIVASILDEDTFVNISVTDQGPGVPLESQSRIFDRFEQAGSNRERTNGQSGTGLGLAICKMIIEGHGGTIGVDSDGKHGSTFWFRIPKKV